MTIIGELGTTACPICGKDTPHWHHPQVRQAVQMIASFVTGAGRDSAFNDRWLKTAQGRWAVEIADEILALAEARPTVVEGDALREALIDWQNSWLCPETNFAQQVPRLLRQTDAALASHEHAMQDTEPLGESGD